jgi:hypothetical protein
MTRPDKNDIGYNFYASSYIKAFIRDSVNKTATVKLLNFLEIMMSFMKHEHKVTSARVGNHYGLIPVKMNLHIAFDALLDRRYPMKVLENLHHLKNQIDDVYTSDAILDIVYETEDLINGLD